MKVDLQQIVQIARSMDRGLDVFSVEVLTWPEARDITPGGFDVVVATFTKSAATRSWIGSAKRKWAKGAELWCVDFNRLFYLKPSKQGALTEALSAAQAAETEILREMLTAWYGRAEADVASLAPVTARLVVKTALSHAVALALQHAQKAAISSLMPPELRRAGGGAEPDRTDRANVEGASLVEARFAVYGPYHIRPGRPFVLDVWAFHSDLKEEVAKEATRHGRHQVLGSKGPIGIEIGKVMSVAVTMPSFRVEPPMDAVLWDGRLANTTFTLSSEPEASPGPQIGTATIMSGSVPVAVVAFQFYLTEGHGGSRGWLSERQQRISSVFASYAHQDRVEVLQWARGAELAGVDVFLDVLKNREGAEWETDLFNHVPTQDLFCLFWSAPASESKWVEMEWRCALAARGLDYIHPVPLVDPRVVPPPAELRSKHFSSPAFIAREYEKGLRPDAGV